MIGGAGGAPAFDKVPLKEATEYAGEDADIALRLWKRFKPRMTTEHAERVYKRVDQPLIPVIGRSVLSPTT